MASAKQLRVPRSEDFLLAMIESTQRSVARSRPEIGRRVYNRMPDRIRLAARERLLQFTALEAPCHC
jgi:hypothetical protein